MSGIYILDDPEALSIKAADIFIDLSGRYTASKKRFMVAVSGGSTPTRLYALLGSHPYNAQVDWRYIHFFWVDERFVPPFHKDSNYRLLHDNLLNRISIPQKNIHPVKTDLPGPQSSARNYEEEIRNSFGLSELSLPQFDLILLGIGEDGHTASLFPNSEVLRETQHLAAPVMDVKHAHYRITLTLPVINHAEEVVFLVSGKNKAAVLEKVVAERDRSLPASLVSPQTGKLIFLIDKEAGACLKNK